jgi:tagaturonate reductase
MNKLDNKFIEWIKNENYFCNSLVDRIVPGKLSEKDKTETEKKLGYRDDLMIMAESFRLWAIESDNEKVKNILSFSKADEGVVIAPDIEMFRELKLRLLNGTHTFSCGLAFLAGFKTVKEAINDSRMASFIHDISIHEIAVAMAGEKISYADACIFSAKVMDRFRNPFLEHPWINIAVQYSSKMKMRNIPLLLKHYEKTNRLPELMALGFAAYLLFMKCDKNQNGQYVGNANGAEYVIQDDQAVYFAEKWKTLDADCLVDSVLSDKNFWGEDLSQLNGFAESVKNNLCSLMKDGVVKAIGNLNKATA